jgi:hypothetical protein
MIGPDHVLIIIILPMNCQPFHCDISVMKGLPRIYQSAAKPCYINDFIGQSG